MQAKPMYWIGLMTGSAVDACDAVIMSCDREGYQCMAAHLQPMPADLKQQALSLLCPQQNELALAMTLDQELACWYAQCVAELLEKTGISKSNIGAIGMHGQTVRHQPTGQHQYSVQLGNPSRLSALTSLPVVANFRSADLAVGGQGAPLAPLFHKAFFGVPEEQRLVVNMGGIANISLLGQSVLGFDTGPANALLDAWIQEQRDLSYDRYGSWAESGQVIDSLLLSCLDDPFFQKMAPKSTGRDYFNLAWLRCKGDVDSYRPEDVQATLMQLTVSSVADAVRQLPGFAAGQLLIVCGGGAYNTALMGCLRQALPDRLIRVSDDFGIEACWVEAMGFAWLAEQRIHGNKLQTQSITGAERAVMLGGIYES